MKPDSIHVLRRREDDLVMIHLQTGDAVHETHRFYVSKFRDKIRVVYQILRLMFLVLKP